MEKRKDWTGRECNPFDLYVKAANGYFIFVINIIIINWVGFCVPYVIQLR